MLNLPMLLHLVTSSAGAEPPPPPLADHAALLRHLETGGTVHAVIRYGRCLRNSEPGPDVMSAVSLERFEAIAKGAIGNPVAFVATSDSQLVVHPVHGHVLELVRLKIHDDDRAELTTQYVDPRKFKVLEQDVFGCSVGPNGGVTLYPR